MDGHHQVFPRKWSGYKPRNNSGVPTKEDIDNPGNWNLYSYTPVYDKKHYVHHKTPDGAIVLPKHPLMGKEKLVIGPSTTMDGGQVLLTEKPT